jgi:hypothetical protein
MMDFPSLLPSFRLSERTGKRDKRLRHACAWITYIQWKFDVGLIIAHHLTLGLELEFSTYFIFLAAVTVIIRAFPFIFHRQEKVEDVYICRKIGSKWPAQKCSSNNNGVNRDEERV